MKIRLAAFADEAATGISEQIAALKRDHISLIELRNADGVNVWDWSEDKAKEIYDKLEEGGIQTWSIGSPIGKVPVDTDMNEYRKGCRKIFRIANIMHTKKVRVFSFFNAYERPELVTKNLIELVKEAAEYGVELYHENEKDIFGDVAERTEYLLSHVNGLKSVFDPANYVQCGQDVKSALSALAPSTDYFHIKDIEKSTGKIVPSGMGDGCIGEIVDSIVEDKTLTVEPHLRIFDGYGQIDGTPMKNKYVFPDSATSFDCAVDSLKKVLAKKGFIEDDRGDFYASKVDRRSRR